MRHNLLDLDSTIAYDDDKLDEDQQGINLAGLFQDASTSPSNDNQGASNDAGQDIEYSSDKELFSDATSSQPDSDLNSVLTACSQ